MWIYNEKDSMLRLDGPFSKQYTTSHLYFFDRQ
jgi:hypothetical protein